MNTKKNQVTHTVKGVIVDPVQRKKFGAELQISGGLIKKITPNPNVFKPYILPGFVDAHVHIESSMLVPSQFAKMAVKHGTVGVVTDPHEVANVAGEDGVRFMIENAKSVPLNFFFGVPSCVPASPLEKSGATLSSKDVEKMIKERDFYYLAEMMNFPGVINNDEEVSRKIVAAKSLNKPVDGHAPGLEGEGLKKYANAGISTDHECSTIEEAEEKISLGMKILVREGSAAKNFKTLIPLIKKYPQQIMFCTDDCHPDYLKTGHINKLVSRSVGLGYDLFDTLQAATINPIKHYNLPLGTLQQGDSADFILVNNLKEFEVISTFIKGAEVFGEGEVSFSSKETEQPKFIFRNQHTKGKIGVVVKSKRMNVIGAVDGELLTKWIKEDVKASVGDIINANPDNDFLKIVLLDRYENTEPVVAFIRGFGLKKGAIAASVAHDSHHIVAVGCDDESIDNALGWIVQNKGGLCFSIKTKTNGIALPFFGLMTNEEGEEISRKYEEINKLVKETGCSLSSPFMTASFMALTVIPELKIYHNGLFDGLQFKPAPLFC